MPSVKAGLQYVPLSSAELCFLKQKYEISHVIFFQSLIVCGSGESFKDLSPVVWSVIISPNNTKTTKTTQSL